MSRKTGILHQLRRLGFDRSCVVPFERGARIGCSQCQAASINGVPCHERGCPHATHECKGCNETIPARQTYCADCAS